MFKSTPKTAAQILAPLHTKQAELNTAIEEHLAVIEEKTAKAHALMDEVDVARAEVDVLLAATKKLASFLGGDDANI